MNTILRVNVIGAVVLMGMLGSAAPDSPVADAAKIDDVESVLALIEHGADVNAARPDGMTPLHWAAENGNADLADILIYAGARVHTTTRLGRYTPLHLASRGGHARAVLVLLAAGADPNALTSTGAVTPLHFAAASGSVEAVTALVERGADVNLGDRQWGHTPLMFAAARNRPDAVRALLEQGAEPEITGSVIDLVQRSKEDKVAQSRRDSIVQRGLKTQGITGFYLKGHLTEEKSALPVLVPLKATSSVEEIGGYGGHTALTLAARDGNTEAVMALLEGGADINQVRAADHTSPLLIAAISGYFDLAVKLLDLGADPNKASDSGLRPLFATLSREWYPAAPTPGPNHQMYQRASYLELMEALLKAGADPDARLKYNDWVTEQGSSNLRLNWVGGTAFLRAAHAADLAAMKLLVHYGANPHIALMRPPKEARLVTSGESARKDIDLSGLRPVAVGAPGTWAIHLAAGYGWGESYHVANVHRYVVNGWLSAVKYLVEEHGFDVGLPDYYLDTPLHNAAARGDNELVLYLVSKGADVMAVNRQLQTTVDMANSPEQRTLPFPETIKLLEGLGAKNNHKCITC